MNCMALIAPKKNTVGTAIAWIASHLKVKIGYATGVFAGCAFGFAASATRLWREYACVDAMAYPKPSPANKQVVQCISVPVVPGDAGCCRLSFKTAAAFVSCAALAGACGCTNAAAPVQRRANESQEHPAMTVDLNSLPDLYSSK